VLRAESLDELDVLCLSARLVEDAKVGLTLVEGLGALAETTSKTIVDLCVMSDEFSGWTRTETDHGLLENFLESVFNAHLASLGSLGGGSLDLGGSSFGSIDLYVRHVAGTDDE
jgi:hypothetical protein